MTTTATSDFARIGRAFPSEVFETLYQTSLASRATRRTRSAARSGAPDKVWRGSGEPVALPMRLPG